MKLWLPVPQRRHSFPRRIYPDSGTYGDRAIIQIENLLEAEDRKILFVHDSFADSVIPFMALGIQSIDSIDLRYFTGSLESYIEESEPDMVIVMYNAGEVSEDVEYLTHTDLFDFR